jgi:hypothetical protein
MAQQQQQAPLYAPQTEYMQMAPPPQLMTAAQGDALLQQMSLIASHTRAMADALCPGKTMSAGVRRAFQVSVQQSVADCCSCSQLTSAVAAECSSSPAAARGVGGGRGLGQRR